MLKIAYEHGYSEALSFYKIAGGPGSGVSGDNTAPIDMPHCPYVSIGTRKGILDNMHFTEKTVKVADVDHCGQENYVPSKLDKFISDPSLVTGKPIDVLEFVGEDGKKHISCVDGHHRLLAAQKLGIKELKAHVRVKSPKTYDKDGEKP